MSHKRFSKSLIPVAFATLGLAGTASAQQPQQEQEQERQPQPQQQERQQQPQQQQQQQMQRQQRMEKQGLAQLHAVNQGATDLGLIGINRAQNEDVREFAGTIVEEHQESDRELMKKAQEMNIDVAGTRETRKVQEKLEQRHQQDIEGLEQATGHQFDRQYVELLVQTHRQAVNELRQQRQQVQNPQVQQAMDDRMQKVQEHLQKAQELQREIQQEEQPG